MPRHRGRRAPAKPVRRWRNCPRVSPPALTASADRTVIRSQAVATAHDPLQNLDRKAFVNSVDAVAIQDQRPVDAASRPLIRFLSCQGRPRESAGRPFPRCCGNRHCFDPGNSVSPFLVFSPRDSARHLLPQASDREPDQLRRTTKELEMKTSRILAAAALSLLAAAGAHAEDYQGVHAGVSAKSRDEVQRRSRPHRSRSEPERGARLARRRNRWRCRSPARKPCAPRPWPPPMHPTRTWSAARASTAA